MSFCSDISDRKVVSQNAFCFLQMTKDSDAFSHEESFPFRQLFYSKISRYSSWNSEQSQRHGNRFFRLRGLASGPRRIVEENPALRFEMYHCLRSVSISREHLRQKFLLSTHLLNRSSQKFFSWDVAKHIESSWPSQVSSIQR